MHDPITPASLSPVHAAADLVGHMAADITIRAHTLHTDEPAAAGGTDSGPTPVELLLGALASCTILTMRLYANRKGWDLRTAHAAVEGMKDKGEQIRSAIVRVSFDGNLDDTQRARLLEIAAKCPVHRALAAGVPVQVQPA